MIYYRKRRHILEYMTLFDRFTKRQLENIDIAISTFISMTHNAHKNATIHFIPWFIKLI